ncbi:unnamed protein product [Phytophthora fragariaefolia]|uniref:Unnamed protein product n=1 Tax=Phytophthora fragariaefolia TaxID=1490495 RepID=A0A9W6UD61_9STRA|nr:unnamed protein product [Phytophthora fragariaefolia]
MAGSGSRKKEGRRQLAESGPSRQSRRVANLGVEPHRSLEDVERDARKANTERRKAAKEAKEVLAQEGVTSGSKRMAYRFKCQGTEAVPWTRHVLVQGREQLHGQHSPAVAAPKERCCVGLDC